MDLVFCRMIARHNFLDGVFLAPETHFGLLGELFWQWSAVLGIHKDDGFGQNFGLRLVTTEHGRIVKSDYFLW
jgi:hypothetical protein